MARDTGDGPAKTSEAVMHRVSAVVHCTNK
jgi:hypothetical protein